MPVIKLNGTEYCDSPIATKQLTQAEYDALPVSKLTDGILYVITDSDGAIDASSVGYDNTNSGLKAKTLQECMDEIAPVKITNAQYLANKTYYDSLPNVVITDAEFGASAVGYDNTESGLSSDNVQSAIDESVGLISHRNLLDNPFFTVNQRGASSYSGSTDSGITVDRWRRETVTSVVVDDCGITSTTEDSNHWAIFQIVNDSVDLHGKTVTLSASTDRGILKNTFNIPESPSESLENLWGSETESLNLLIQVTSSVIQAGIVLVEPGSVTIESVKLEFGARSTLALDSAPNYAEELYKCQQSTADSTDTYANGYNPIVGDAYSSTKTYTKGECTIYNNVVYQAIQGSFSGIVPTNTTYWEVTSLSKINENLNKISNKYNFSKTFDLTAVGWTDFGIIDLGFTLPVGTYLILATLTAVVSDAGVILVDFEGKRGLIGGYKDNNYWPMSTVGLLETTSNKTTTTIAIYNSTTSASLSGIGVLLEYIRIK